MSNTLYTPVWHKYRPAILKLMLDSNSEPQTYSLSAHEFQALNPRQKGGYQFNLQLAKGRAVNNIKDSFVAQSLLHILQLSRKGSELIEEGSYEIRLDKNFILHIQKLSEQEVINT
jgi:hypothetical protein